MSGARSASSPGDLGAGAPAGEGRVLLDMEAREPEIGDARPAVLADQDVVRLDVAVDEPLLVRRREAAAGLDPRDERGLPRAGLLAAQVAERPAVDELHRHEHAPLVLADLVDGDDVRVREPGHHLRLAHEAGPILGIEPPRRDELEGDAAVELRVVGRIDDAHPALAGLGEHREPPDARAGAQRFVAVREGDCGAFQEPVRLRAVAPEQAPHLPEELRAARAPGLQERPAALVALVERRLEERLYLARIKGAGSSPPWSAR